MNCSEGWSRQLQLRPPPKRLIEDRTPPCIHPPPPLLNTSPTNQLTFSLHWFDWPKHVEQQVFHQLKKKKR
ncbi:hypothetical protein PFLUV_G00068460 [Perca fluviatilis]|uniref:Uncharacterized protein n=1 Tax=Perca fluviatilis TaxID=8168 RepID=A0A6A5EI62_PERFL|nr:hypothetical protein PFLUV_G00068460 [Perca fluviatilis]